MLRERKYFCWFVIGVFLCAVISGGCGSEISFPETEDDYNVNRNNDNSTNQNTNQNNSNGTQTNNGTSNNTNQNNNSNNSNPVGNGGGTSISYKALAGTWAGLKGNGTFYAHGEAETLIVEEVEYYISDIQYSESTGTGTAKLFYERAVDEPLISKKGELNRTYTMKNVGENSWSLTYEQESITLTLTSETKGTVEDSGIVSNTITYNLGCDIEKFNVDHDDVSEFDATKFTGTWKPSSGYIDVRNGEGDPWIGGKLIPGESDNVVINVTPSADGYNIQISAYKFVYRDVECEEEALNTELSSNGTFGYTEEDGTTVNFEIYVIDEIIKPQGTIIRIVRKSSNTATGREEKGSTYLHRAPVN